MKQNRKKTVGVLGGMGPVATAKFFQRLVELTPAKAEAEHLRIFVDNNVDIPPRAPFFFKGGANPVPGIVAAINQLSAIGADFVVLPCNSVHVFYDEVSPQITIPWLSMVDAVSQDLGASGLAAPVILGARVTVQMRLYSRLLPRCVYLAEPTYNYVYEAIDLITANQRVPERVMKPIVQGILDHRHLADGILLACTELSLCADDLRKLGLAVFDSTEIYAGHTVKCALGTSSAGCAVPNRELGQQAVNG